MSLDIIAGGIVATNSCAYASTQECAHRSKYRTYRSPCCGTAAKGGISIGVRRWRRSGRWSINSPGIAIIASAKIINHTRVGLFDREKRA